MTDTPQVPERIWRAARIAHLKRGSNLTVLDVGGLTSFTDYFLLVTASSDRRVRTIAEAIRAGMKAEGLAALGVEGLSEGKWALIDFGSFVVHVFFEELRGRFDLEGLWSEGKNVPIPDWVTAPAEQAAEEN